MTSVLKSSADAAGEFNWKSSFTLLLGYAWVVCYTQLVYFMQCLL